MLWFLKTFWRVIVSVGLFIGLYYIPADLEGWREASAPWKRWLAMFDQVTALWIVAGACLAYIAWMDIRPFASRLRSGEKYSISVGDHIQWTSKFFEIDGEKYVKNFAYLLVYNNSRTGKTAKNVRVRKYPVSTQYDAPTRDGKVCVDMHHGEQEWFLLGSLISKTSYGWAELDEDISEADREAAAKGVSFGSYTFMIAEKAGIGLHYKGVNEENFSANPMSFVVVRVSAQDTPTLQVDLHFDRQKLERGEGESQIQSPIRISEVKKL